ncbi:protein PLASTID REDOX INSENSITIVE 2, chloroplastic-like [Lotus japonicus]|uniref:Uncharacterized protein n=1 Tax=Lotus japonicus TaxID=34305 RepID=I3SX82_LOTJA|nr:protein PLASTID REDOX INSENSITIVE 2, chloroplastic-like [Lotus japonicus]AFK44874.1 unknown [Lotus japonicus]
MLLFTPSLLSGCISTVTLSPPAKTFPSNTLILPHHCFRLSSSSLFVKLRPSFALRDSLTTHKKHVYPDPSPEFAESETQKFRIELFQKLSQDEDEFGDHLHAVIDVCAQIFNEFLQKEYGGPGTLLVEPFTDMLVALKKKKLPGAPLAARASLLWAQNYVDHDWEVRNSKPE